MSLSFSRFSFLSLCPEGKKQCIVICVLLIIELKLQENEGKRTIPVSETKNSFRGFSPDVIVVSIDSIFYCNPWCTDIPYPRIHFATWGKWEESVSVTHSLFSVGEDNNIRSKKENDSECQCLSFILIPNLVSLSSSLSSHLVLSSISLASFCNL